MYSAVMEIFVKLDSFNVIYLICIFMITLLVIYLKYKPESKHDRFAKSLPGPMTLPFMGNALPFILHPEDISMKIFNYTEKYGHRYRLWIGRKLTLVLSNPDDVQEALKGSKFLDKGDDFHNLFGRAFGNSTFSGEVAEWKKSRKILQYPMKTNAMENYINIIHNQANKVVEKLQPVSESGQIFDISHYIGFATFAIICQALYDLKNEISEEEYFVFQKSSGRFLEDSFRSMFLPKFIRIIEQSMSKTKLKEILTKMELAYQYVLLEGRLQQTVNSEDKKFIDYLSDQHFKNAKKKAEIITFSVGGSETSTSSISFALLQLGIYPDIQDKVYDELYRIFGESDRDATDEDIKSMIYLEQVLKESMRHYPFVPLIFRYCREDTAVGNLIIPAGTEVIFPIFELHRNSHYFCNPEVFNPENFSLENSRELHQGCYLPFAIGPRNCIGKAFAMYELKILCSAILRKYRIHTTMKKEDIKLRCSFVLTSANGFQISISKRIK